MPRCNHFRSLKYFLNENTFALHTFHLYLLVQTPSICPKPAGGPKIKNLFLDWPRSAIVKVDLGRDPFNHNSNRSDREKRSTSKGGPVFPKLFRFDRTDPLSFGPKFLEILVEWIAPLIREKCNFRGYMRCRWGRLELLLRITFTLNLNISPSL